MQANDWVTRMHSCCAFEQAASVPQGQQGMMGMMAAHAPAGATLPEQLKAVSAHRLSCSSSGAPGQAWGWLGASQRQIMHRY